jgi:CheY-like chemotaxis protein
MSKKRILIVDDEEDTLKLLKMIVEISGYEGITTLNSLDALRMAQVEQPDVILLDIMMPKLDGFQLCKMIRVNPTTRELPVIFITAYNALDLEDRRVASGGDMVLQKPVGMQDLITAIDQVQTMERAFPDELKKASAGMTAMLNPFKVAAPKPKETPAPPSPAKAEADPKPVEVTPPAVAKPAEATPPASPAPDGQATLTQPPQPT